MGRQGKPTAVTYETRQLKTFTKMAGSISPYSLLPNATKLSDNTSQGERGVGVFYTEPRQETSYYSVRPQLFQTEVKSPLPLPPACVRSQPVADIRQPTAGRVPAGTLSGLRACFCPSCLSPPRLASLFCCLPYLSPLSSQAKPNVLPNPRKEMPLVPSSPLWVSRFPLFRSVQTRRPPICMFWLCLYIYETTPSSRTGARAKVPSTSSLASFRYFR